MKRLLTTSIAMVSVFVVAWLALALFGIAIFFFFIFLLFLFSYPGDAEPSLLVFDIGRSSAT